jgi:4-hydroxybutyrate CoA-transferase
LLVGVKFCGGCNSGYDRRAAYEKIKDGVSGATAAEKGAGINFEQAKESVRYDALLVICGCANRCATVTGYTARLPYVYVWNEAGVSEAVRRLTEPAVGEERGSWAGESITKNIR